MASEDPYLLAFDQAPIAIRSVDAQGIIVYANLAELAVLGYERDEYVGHNIMDFVFEPQKTMASYSRLEHEGHIANLEITFRHKNGSPVRLIVDATACFQNDQFSHTRCFSIDITEAKRRESMQQMQYEITKLLVSASSISEALTQVLAVLRNHLNVDAAMVWRTDTKANRLARLVFDIKGDRNEHDFLLTRSVSIPLAMATGFPATVWYSGRVQEIQLGPQVVCFGENHSRLAREYQSVVAFPIAIGRRQWGVAALFSKGKDLLDATLAEPLDSIGKQVAQFVDKVEANEALLKIQERYYVAITGSRDGIWDWDLVSNEVFFSPRWKEQLGYEDNELGNNFDVFRELCHPEDFSRVMDEVQNHIESKTPYDTEFRMRTKSGDHKWINARGQAVWDNRGRPVRMAGCHSDIDFRKASEVAQKEYERKLLESELMFRQLTENIKEVFWIVDNNTGDFIYASPAFEEIWGESCSALYKDREHFFAHIHEDDIKQVRALLTRKSIAASVMELEFRLLGPKTTAVTGAGKDKAARWIWARVFPVLDDHNAPVRFCGIAHDITEKKEVERRVSEFYSTVSHELRTPLTSVRAALGLIEGGLTGEIPEETMEYTRIARDNCDRLIRLINDILDLRKLEAEKLELRLRNLSALDIVKKTVESMKAYGEERGISVEISGSSKRDFIGDSDRVVQILTNLLSNAIKYTPAGKGVKVTVSENEKAVRVSVEDQGQGIPPEKIPELFGLFQQLSCMENERNVGTGLGLAISKGLVEKQGGKIGVQSEIGIGSTFWFELPAATYNMALVEVDHGKTQQNSEVPNLLLLEDSDSIAMLLKAFLTRKGFHTMRASTLREARELVRESQFDLIFADINLPDGSGIEFINWLHSQDADKVTPVIVLSGSEHNGHELAHPEVIDWVKKPFEGEELLRLLGQRLFQGAKKDS